MEKAPNFSSDFLHDFDALLSWRRDVRHFDRRPLPSALINELLDKACLAPSVGNSQPWRFVRVVSNDRRSAIIAQVESENAKAGARYEAENRTNYAALKLHGLIEAPEHIAVYCETAPVEGSGLGRQTMPETLEYSTVLAIHTLWLAARTRGVGLGWVSILEPAAVARILDITSTWRLVGYLCLGYPLEAHDIPELVRAGWQERIDPILTRFIR